MPIYVPLLRVANECLTMPPVASKRHRLFPEGTPERLVQNAVKAKYDDVFERFFEEVAEALNIEQDTAAGTFYALLRSGTGDSTRAIPQRHADVYVEKLSEQGVTSDVIAQIEAKRPLTRPGRRDPLAELEARVGWLESQLGRVATALGIELDPPAA